MNDNLDRHIPKTKEEKEAHKALKLLEKQKRKEKSLQKASNNNVENELVKSVQKLSTSSPSNQQKPSNIKDKRVRKASDMVSFTETPVVLSASRPKNDKSNLCNQKILDRPQEVKQVQSFKHLYYPDRRGNFVKTVDQIPDSVIHPEIKKLGLALDSHSIRGSTLRCQKFLESLKLMISDLPINSGEDFTQTFSVCLDRCVEFLAKCRPLPVTITTAINYLKLNLSMLNESDNEKCRKEIIDMVDQFLNERIEMAHKYIHGLTSDYFKNDHTILVYSYSQLVFKSILHAWTERKSEKGSDFKLIVVDTFPDSEGRKMMTALENHEIPYDRINLASVLHLMPKIDFVILGAFSVLSNSNVVSCSGSASIANAAKLFSKSVIVCVETFKFNMQNQSDSFEYNELNNPNIIVEQICQNGDLNANDVNRMNNWRDLKSNITVTDLLYDVIPGYMIQGICCEFGIISPTAVSYVSHVKQPY